MAKPKVPQVDKPKVRVNSSKTATAVAPPLAGPNKKLAPHIQAKQELNDLRDMLTAGEITREQYEASYPDLAQNLFDNQEKNGFEIDLDGIRENYYNPPEIDPTQSSLLGPVPDAEAMQALLANNNTDAARLALMNAQAKAEAEAAAAAAQGPPRFQSARDLEMTEEDNPRIAPDLPPRTTPTPQPIITQAAPQASQPPVTQAVHPMAQMMAQAAASPPISPPGGPPGGPPTPPNKSSAYWHIPIPKPTLDNAGKLFKGGGQMLGGAGLAGATLVGGNALYKLLGTPPPERTLEEKIDSNPIFNFDPNTPGQR